MNSLAGPELLLFVCLAVSPVNENSKLISSLYLANFVCNHPSFRQICNLTDKGAAVFNIRHNGNVRLVRTLCDKGQGVYGSIRTLTDTIDRHFSLVLN